MGLTGWHSLTAPQRLALEQATLLVGSRRQLASFTHLPAEHLPLTTFTETLRIAEARWRGGDRLAVLASGDPLCFGIGRLLLAQFPAESLVFHPHVSALQLAFNRLKLPWQDAVLTSVHGRDLEELSQHLRQGAEKIAILTDGVHNPGAIAALYQSLDLPSRYQIWVCENLGGPDERVWRLPLDAQGPFAPLNVVVMVRQTEAEPLPPLPLLGISDRHFLTWPDRPGLMTKREVRIAILGELALMPGQVVWDIGAGTGSVAVEVARLCPDSQVFAIEKTAMGIHLIGQNAQRFGVTVAAIAGTAPTALTELPDPDRIFIGGGGQDLATILSHSHSRLKPGGRIVIALATLESLQIALTALQGQDYQVLQWNVARSHPIAHLHRMAPLNPVTLITVM
ncbi:precorrin-6y C5,15-methyltransferase (decarboxylating) subunit CbiE [Spirulina sp. CCNP1310]|uniref:precorrin-6y C5,15-methyltransferase (decarboxylating) subunit CbiE n=1 Tax=Spirulina sp. CCNP1310 TaxID=3110249 RepID=UPI002B20BD2F|nr:precorrin-6y C5,15-methyltransferase (decarboxylating) subunit CbiE [Spirulina sp. CCNP1310]MEA5418348.1 precorrin-6y C5,15-methyltransferase (decarboxylating) subunit CbiE [Spirulina sp. CCNP1310]